MAISPDAAAGGIAQLAEVIVKYSVYGIQAAEFAITEHKKGAETEVINQIKGWYEECLKNIPVLDRKGRTIKTISLPEIFQGKPGEAQTADSLNASTIAALNNRDPLFSDARLMNYGKHINYAMLALQEFYISRIKDRVWMYRGKSEDITSSVLSYLILNISTWCYRIDSHSETLACLGALTTFVNKFASSHGKKSDRYTHLTPVYCDLQVAHIKLWQNNLSLSYQTMLSEICPALQASSKKLMKYCLQLFLPNKHWIYVDRVTTRLLQAGKVKNSYPHSHSLIGEIKIPDCIFKDWIEACARHYILALSIEDHADKQGGFIDGSRFDYEDKLGKKEIAKIKLVFAESENFFTHQTFSNAPEWKKIDKPELIKKRVDIFSKFMLLIDKINAVIYFCAHMSNRVQQLGEIYVSNPNHCAYIFEVLHGLGDKIESLLKELRDTMEFIQKDSVHFMPTDNIQALFKNLNDELGALTGICVDPINDLFEKHRSYPKTAKSKNENRKIKPNRDVMLMIAQRIAEQYKITTVIQPEVKLAPLDSRLRSLSFHSSAGYDAEDSTTSMNSPRYEPSENKADDLLEDIEEKSDDEADDDSKDEKIVDSQQPGNTLFNHRSAAPAVQVEGRVQAPTVSALELTNKLASMHEYILDLEAKHDLTAKNCILYKKLHKSLTDLKTRGDKMLLETTPKRVVKGQKILALVTKLSAEMYIFLHLPAVQRTTQATAFSQKIHTALDDQNYLDDHKRTISSYFFKTTSRKKGNEILELSDKVRLASFD
jgi:hypothetical protein